MQAALTIQQWQGSDVGINAYVEELSTQIDKVNASDMKRPEAMLLMQACTLDGLFNNLARKAQIQSHMPHCESFLRLALKTQGQCRSTLETLSTIKNPPVIFAKQANISNGHQQINNGMPAPGTHTEEIINQSNELLEQTHGERLDSGTKGETISINTELEAVG
ncbi:MAG: hypothetical protein ACXW1W_17915 [Methylococcaceae bacterium]